MFVFFVRSVSYLFALGGYLDYGRQDVGKLYLPKVF